MLKKLIFTAAVLKKLILVGVILYPSYSEACEEHAKAAEKGAHSEHGEHAGHNHGAASEGYAKVEVISGPGNKTNTVKIRLSEADNGKPIGLDGLKEVHTEKLHLLVIDPTLEDYHHIHPTASKTKGVYEFTLKPSKAGYYRAYADITPTATSKQEYTSFLIGRENRMMPKIDKTVVTEKKVAGLDFKLAFESAPVAGKAVMGSVKITKDGKDFDKLEPVMGAYGHIVAFSNGGREVSHVHPMGAEPKSESDRGGPKLEFHLEPKEQGFTKIYVQVKVGGKDVYVPFGIEVN